LIPLLIFEKSGCPLLLSLKIRVEEKFELGCRGNEKAEVEVIGDFIFTAIIESAF
jgi:hypothetical protein